jgi:hypothetical protein
VVIVVRPVYGDGHGVGVDRDGSWIDLVDNSVLWTAVSVGNGEDIVNSVVVRHFIGSLLAGVGCILSECLFLFVDFTFFCLYSADG